MAHVRADHRVCRKLPGIDGMGYIDPVPPGRWWTTWRRRAATTRATHAAPDTQASPTTVVKYFESQAATSKRDRSAFNIAFEANRHQAAELAPTSGESTISCNIVLQRTDRPLPGSFSCSRCIARQEWP